MPHYSNHAPSPHPARRTVRAVFPHTALGQGTTPLRVGLAAGRGTPPGVPEPLIGGHRLIATLPALMPLPAPSLNSGPFPPPQLPGLDGTTNPSATPASPACPSRASGCRPLPHTDWGFPCCLGSPLRTCRRQYPGGTAGSDRSGDGLFQPSPSDPATSAFPGSMAGRLPHHCFRGLLSVHYSLRPARSRGHSLALCIGGSGGFVTSAAAPIASGRSDPVAGWGLHPRKTRALPRRT